MTYQVLQLPAAPNQAFDCVLDGRQANINLTTTDYGLYADVTYDGEPVITGRLCLDRVDINANRYTGLPQALFFADLQGTTDPQWSGFNTRYLLVYGEPDANGGTTVA